MPAVKTLVPSPPQAADPGRPSQRAQKILPPAARAGTEKTSERAGIESSFRDLFRRAAHHVADRSVGDEKSSSRRIARTDRESPGAHPSTAPRRSSKAGTIDDADRASRSAHAPRSAESSPEADDAIRVAEETQPEARPADAPTVNDVVVREDGDASPPGDPVEPEAEGIAGPQEAEQAAPEVQPALPATTEPVSSQLLAQLGKRTCPAPRAAFAAASFSQSAPPETGEMASALPPAQPYAELPSATPANAKTAHARVAQPGLLPEPIAGAAATARHMSDGQAGGSELAGKDVTTDRLVRGATAALTRPDVHAWAAETAADSPARELARLLAMAGGLTEGLSVSAGRQAQDSVGNAAESAALADMPQGRTAASQSSDVPAVRLAAEGVPDRPPVQSLGQVPSPGRPVAGQVAQDFDKVVELVRANVGTKNSTFTIQLEPPELGRIRLHAALHDDALTVRVQVETQAARSILESRLGELRQALDRQGISMEKFEIQTRPAPPSQDAQDGGHRDSNYQPSGSQQDAEGGMAYPWQHRHASPGGGGDVAASGTAETDPSSDAAVRRDSETDVEEERIAAGGPSVNLWA